MSDTVSWIFEVAVNPGSLDAFRTLMGEMVEATSASEPGTLAYEWFVNEEGTAVHIYERYADSAAVMVHLGNFGQKFAERFFDLVTASRLDVYGSPGDEVKDGLTDLGPVYLAPFGGFAR